MCTRALANLLLHCRGSQCTLPCQLLINLTIKILTIKSAIMAVLKDIISSKPHGLAFIVI